MPSLFQNRDLPQSMSRHPIIVFTYLYFFDRDLLATIDLNRTDHNSKRSLAQFAHQLVLFSDL